MIIIKNIRASIFSKEEEKFGFDFSFEKGLNIITGYNSSGKSTVLSCIYYCLGMEQLLGSYNADDLDDSLIKGFKYNGQTDYKIFNSFAEITIESNNGKIATIKRVMKTAYQESLDKIDITEDGATSTKYLHAKGDSDSNKGFYKWLADFTEIEIPQYKSKKILYLQHIFACALVEQTKGWSDFFSQIPTFNVVKPKQKIIEYSLGLNGLIDEFKSDLLKIEEKQLKQKWTNIISSFRNLTDNFNVTLPSLDDSFSASVTHSKIEKLNLYKKNEDGNHIAINDFLTNLNALYSKVVLDNKIKIDKVNTNELYIQNNLLKKEIYNLDKQLREILLEKVNEEKKLKDYKIIIDNRQKEIETLESFSRYNELNNLDISDVDNCPVCNTSLLKTDIVNLKNQDKVDTLGSVAFYKSEKKLYESYLKNSDSLMSKFEKVKLYYETQIAVKKRTLDLIKKELVEDSRIPSRSDIAREINIKNEIDKYENLQNHLNILKEDITPIVKRLATIRQEIKDLKDHFDKDDAILKIFKDYFKKLLKEFDYSKELLDKIIINHDEPQKLLPKIYSGSNEKAQPIRLKSSASDFIRCLWAYYLALLEKSKNHIGFLILDEPGQHAMDKESMKSLLKHTSTLKNRQVILAISKNRPVVNKTNTSEAQKFKLSEIIGDLKENVDYTINTIDDNGREDKCVQKL